MTKEGTTENIYIEKLNEHLRPVLVHLRNVFRQVVKHLPDDNEVVYRERLLMLALQYGIEAIDAATQELFLLAQSGAQCFVECVLIHLMLAERDAVLSSQFYKKARKKKNLTSYTEKVASLYFSDVILIALELKWFNLTSSGSLKPLLLPDAYLVEIGREFGADGENLEQLRGVLIVLLAKERRNDIHPGRFASRQDSPQLNRHCERMFLMSFELFLMLKEKIDSVNASFAPSASS